ncbi:SGNH/GDSL hydrolase family protein [Mycolicibacterium goodii]|uniref:SGNH/GDSL hydrolase family protein n=1 Tax=Mycolicibacterium goodii TaxID=134601 RepID=UPI000C267DFE|nr:SGNH/GDSL hydrolase family protein [Mycolicibacterium goodii]PJK21578.1 lipase [Mycolicibacterium goodii]
MTSSSLGLTTHAITVDLFRGLAELEDTGRGRLPHRLPRAARARCDDPQLLGAEAQPAGVRLAVRTAATVIELDVLRTRVVLRGVPARADGTVDLLIDGRRLGTATVYGGDVVSIDPSTGVTETAPGEVATLRFDGLPAQGKTIEVWLPHYERTEVVAVRTDAPIAPAHNDRPTWVHHGSSISQGSNADTPSTTWPALVASDADLDLVNLGFSGSAMLDPFVARVIRDRSADLISIKIGINLVNADLMRRRAFGPAVHGFLDTIRDGHPSTPLIVIGPLHCRIHETTPGPGSFDVDALASGTVRFVALGDPADALVPNAGLRRLTLGGIRDQLAEIMAGRQADDPHLTYVDGLDLYGHADEAAHPLPDNLHPDAATHRLIAERFVALTRPGRLVGTHA